MLQNISDLTLLFIESCKLDKHLLKVWVYKDRCVVADFLHKNIRFSFDITPSKNGTVSIDVLQKNQDSAFRIIGGGDRKRTLALDVPLRQALECMRTSVNDVLKAIDTGVPIGGLPSGAEDATGLASAPTPERPGRPKPMKVGVLTLPFNANIGGNLQGYALIEVLRRMGHQPVLINRRRAPKGVRVDDALTKTDTESPLLSDTIALSHAPNRAFIEKHIAPISRDFYSTAHLSNNVDQYGFDAIVVGSDQVWRPKYAKSILFDFFMKFLPEENTRVKRISYAASFGTDDWEYDADQTAEVSSLIKRFSAISVREDSGVTLCRDHLGVEARHVLDPTLLLTPEHYARLFSPARRQQQSGQLLAYILDRNEDKTRVVEELSRRLSINPYSTTGLPFGPPISPEGDEGDASVEGWLAAIHEAAFVVTDSFHGAVFSILFNKPFIAYGNPKRGMARFVSLMRMLGLEDRLVVQRGEIDVDRMLQPIDWAAVNQRLERLRGESQEFLATALAGAVDRKPVAVQARPKIDVSPMSQPAFASNCDAWRVTSLENSVELRVAQGGAVRGNFVWCELPRALSKQTSYRLKVKWAIRTKKRTVNIYVRSKETAKFYQIGSVAVAGESADRDRIDQIEFIVPEDGYSQFMLSALNFAGEQAGAEIFSITVQALQEPGKSATVTDESERKATSSFARNSERLALQDNERFVNAYVEGAGSSGGARARLMWLAHAVEKGLSHADFRAGFGKAAIQKLANEMEAWLAAGRPSDDQFFRAAASVMHFYFKRHEGLGIDVSDVKEFFSARAKGLIAKAGVSHGGVLAASAIREARVHAGQDRSFLDVVYGRRSVREFTSEPVKDEQIRFAVQIAQLAPSVCNRQAPRVHRFTDPETIRAAVDLQRGFRGYKMPPNLLLVTSDLTAMLSPNERNQAFIDGGLFMMSLLLGLEQVGLGSCCLNTAMNSERESSIRKIVKIPEAEVFISFVAVGHFVPTVLTPVSVRYPVDEVLTQHVAAAAQ